MSRRTVTAGILPATGDTAPIALVLMVIAVGPWLTLASRRRQLMN
jgi:LPXTG-motif cell wall-anchored protein